MRVHRFLTFVRLLLIVAAWPVTFSKAANLASPNSGEAVLRIPDLVAFWDFQEPAGQSRVSRAPGALALKEMKGQVERAGDGVFGPFSARLRRGQ